MAYKIALSPEDRSSNKYAVDGTNERDQMRLLANALEQELLHYGFEVKNMQYGGMYDRVADAEMWGADLYLALHTNGFDGKVAGTRVHCYPSEKSRKLGQLIQDRIAPLSPGTSDKLVESTTLYELRAPSCPAVLPEYEFHDNPTAARWIVDHIQLLAEETAKAVCEYYGMKPEQQTEPALYRVQVGAFTVRENAEAFLADVQKHFPDAFIKKEAHT